jgi:DNA-binding LacI/PurR family transcriptional regulator
MRSVTQKQLAKQLDLSASSVSRALADDPRISDETRNRVKEAAARRGYRPNRLATSFRKGSTHTIGLILIDISYPLYSSLARAVEDCAYEQGYNIILCDSDGTPQKEALYLEVLQSKQVDGILMTPLGEEIGARQSLLDTGRPYVLVDAYSTSDGVSTVTFDHAKGLCLATRHLIECGHARIALVTGSHTTPQFRAMLSGYKQALAEAGLRYDPGLAYQVTLRQQLQMEGGYLAIEHLLGLANPPTAAIFSSDYNAVAALRVMEQRKLRVPGDFAIIGYDDTPTGAAVTPALTTVAQDVYELGGISTRILLHEIRAGAECTHQRVVLEPRLIVRQSTSRA